MSEPILSTHALSGGYGDFQALFGVDMHIDPGEVIALIGANGAGKSTFLKSVFGMLPVAKQMVRFDGADVGGTPAHKMVRQGLAMVPEGRRLFAGMSVEDNMRVAIDNARLPEDQGQWTRDRLFDLFPILGEKRREMVENLSGGQQQMVAISRALLCQPRVLLCDEISLGLAPKVIREIYAVVPEISAAGTAIVLVEQDVSLAKSASNRLYCMLEGRITLSGASGEISRDEIATAYFGGSHAVA
ncbi:ABC transporter ATP-binding protein [Actibacterium lipolyticum]|uniref:High-affinity branched-chain amino acid transport ATP-binding protein LivF n=1 Tax=Actibacterium lipolyticum TaxID=1524263 RepID=A0A238L829_9RHOB|nr:ABC transporter ATP-binding protein [Actibacterium lipolyticum]SMX51157.1 High-affinity branched-chain amino acid transport ATP-binding protein LivF [Actibacterium lipolyticum]